MNVHYLLKVKITAFIATAVLVSVSTNSLHAQTSLWTNPSSGFYEDASNWTPNGIPAPGNTVVFGLPGAYDIGFKGTQGAAGFSIANNANIDFVAAGASTDDRLFRVTGSGSVR